MTTLIRTCISTTVTNKLRPLQLTLHTSSDLLVPVRVTYTDYHIDPHRRNLPNPLRSVIITRSWYTRACFEGFLYRLPDQLMGHKVASHVSSLNKLLTHADLETAAEEKMGLRYAEIRQ